MIKFDIKPSFDVTDGPSGVKYIILNEFLTKFFREDKNVDFAYMNFPSDKKTVAKVNQVLLDFLRENNYHYFNFCQNVTAMNDHVYLNTGFGDESNITVYQIELCGDRELFDVIFEVLRPHQFIVKEKAASINWFYLTANGPTSKRIMFDKNNNKTKDIHYPFIKDGVNKYMKNYLKSDNSILIMIGDPGTGKTSLVRDFAFKNKLKTYMTFDENLIRSDDFFVSFMTDKEADLLVIEDADVLISARDDERNDLMAKFLNISDGLVNHQNKKIIFTTNLSNVDKIDSALIRPGRCYGVLNFRKLSAAEANIIREDIGKPAFPIDHKLYTLATIFNESHSNIEKVEKVKVGII